MREALGVLRLAVAAVALAAALCVPIRLSADVWAYAAYGALLDRGIDPYARAYRTADVAPLHDPVLDAALRAWDGSLPRDVYGPFFTVPAAAIVAATGPAGPGGVVLAFRLAASFALLACVALAGGTRPRLATLLAFHPVVLWSAAEGHNDAWWLALVLAADRAGGDRVRLGVLTAAAAVKAVAVVPLAWALLRLRGRRPAALAAGAALALAYAPLAWSVAAHGFDRGADPPRVSLLHAGELAAWSGSWLPLAVALVAACLAAAATLRAVRAGAHVEAAALAGWLLLPAPEPWYALWFLPVVAAGGRRPASLALLVAGITGALGYVQDLAGGTVLRDPALLGGIMFAVYVLPLIVALAAPQTDQQATPPTPPPLVSPSPIPPPSPSPVASPAPGQTQNPYGYVTAPSPGPAGAPRIVEIAVNDRTLHAGGMLLVRVTTSPEIATLVARTMGHEIAIPLASSGVFAGQQQMPSNVPFFLVNRTYSVEFVGTTADGRTVSASVPIRFER